MRTAINKKRIVLYAVCAFFFCLAGVFQAVDSSLPVFWHALFALLAHTILISLVVAWGVSLIHRMVRKDLRAYFLTVAVLILFFLVLRMIKYGLTKDTDALSRYLWYAYYVPQMFIPPTILLAAFSIESKKGKPLAKAWYLLYLPAVILLLLIFTNDVHEWAFALNFENGFSYEHRTVFYIAFAWEIAVTLTSLIVLILKCGISACRRKTWIPVSVFIVCVAVFIVCFLTDTPAFKIPELLCFTCIVMIESCIAIGLIPSNYEYENYFYHSAYSAVITDENFNVIYNSEKSVFTDKILLEQATKCPVMIDENTRLSAAKIHGGYTFRIEDLSKVNEINAALSETNERLSEENYIIEAENELKEQKAQIAERNKLYAKTDEVTCEELKRLDALLSDMYHKTQLNSTEYIDKMRFACILAAYIKRRSNLVMLAEKQESMPECSYIKRAKQIGVEGFWYKEVNEQPILSLMERVMNGEIVYPDSPQPVRMGLALSTEFTEKELEILRLMTGGYSNTEISEKLGVSSGVVKNHVADMLFKTGFRSRTQLAVRARESGLVILDKTDDEI